MPTIRIKPVEAMSWRTDDGPLDQLPEPFILAVQFAEADSWSGIVVTSGHEFTGLRADAFRRNSEQPGEVDIVVRPIGHGPELAAGRAVLE